MREIVVVSVNPPAWRWFERHAERDRRTRFHFFSTSPESWLEKLTGRHVFSQVWAGLRAALAAKRRSAELAIAVDPRTAVWYSLAAAILRPKSRFIVYAFNLAELPRGVRRVVMSWAFRRPDKIVVFSTAEIPLYAKHFGIPSRKFEHHYWAVGKPDLAPCNEFAKARYVAAIGGNGRDYSTLLAAARLTPEVRYVVVARPENVAGLQVPSNVDIVCNIPMATAMRILSDSSFMVLPLRSEDVPCGHVTLVAAMQLGKATVVTRSGGLEDYAIDNENALVVTAGDPSQLAIEVQRLWEDSTLRDRLGSKAQSFALANCGEERAISYFIGMLQAPS